MWFDDIFKVWRSDPDDALPCPICEDDDPEINANVVICLECGFSGPDHGILDGKYLPEIMCDWRDAIEDWNNVPRSPLQRLRYENAVATYIKPELYFK